MYGTPSKKHLHDSNPPSENNSNKKRVKSLGEAMSELMAFYSNSDLSKYDQKK